MASWEERLRHRKEETDQEEIRKDEFARLYAILEKFQARQRLETFRDQVWGIGEAGKVRNLTSGGDDINVAIELDYEFKDAEEEWVYADRGRDFFGRSMGNFRQTGRYYIVSKIVAIDIGILPVPAYFKNTPYGFPETNRDCLFVQSNRRLSSDNTSWHFKHTRLNSQPRHWVNLSASDGEVQHFIEEQLLLYVAPSYLPSVLEAEGKERIEHLVYKRF